MIPAERMMQPNTRTVLGGNMRAYTTTATLLLVTALIGCSNQDDSSTPKATATATVTATKTPELSAEEAREACVDAWAATIDARPDDFNAETDSDPEPDACKGLPEDEWMDRYMEGLTRSNQENLDEMQECLDDPNCTRFSFGDSTDSSDG